MPKPPRPYFYFIRRLICRWFGHSWVHYPPSFDGEYNECSRCWECVRVAPKPEIYQWNFDEVKQPPRHMYKQPGRFRIGAHE